MMIIKNLQDRFGYFAFVLVVRVQPDLHFCFADGHVADGEP